MGSDRVDALTHCPLCGLRIDLVKTPGILDPWGYDGPLMLNPCTCVVPQEVLRHADGWVRVVGDSNTTGFKSGVEIRLEYSGDGLGPIAGEYDEVVVRDGTTPWADEVARYPLSDVHQGVDHAE